MGLNLKDSIYHPRLHLEEDCLHLEPGIMIDDQSIRSRIKINTFSTLQIIHTFHSY